MNNQQRDIYLGIEFAGMLARIEGNASLEWQFGTGSVLEDL